MLHCYYMHRIYTAVIRVNQLESIFQRHRTGMLWINFYCQFDLFRIRSLLNFYLIFSDTALFDSGSKLIIQNFQFRQAFVSQVFMYWSLNFPVNKTKSNNFSSPIVWWKEKCHKRWRLQPTGNASLALYRPSHF